MFYIMVFSWFSRLNAENLHDVATSEQLNFLFRECILKMRVQQIGGFFPHIFIHHCILHILFWYSG
jgi:hypothetical protein